MLFYIFSIVGADLLIILLNILFNKFELSTLYIILAAVLGAIAVIAIDGVFAFINILASADALNIINVFGISSKFAISAMCLFMFIKGIKAKKEDKAKSE